MGLYPVMYHSHARSPVYRITQLVARWSSLNRVTRSQSSSGLHADEEPTHLVCMCATFIPVRATIFKCDRLCVD